MALVVRKIMPKTSVFLVDVQVCASEFCKYLPDAAVKDADINVQRAYQDSPTFACLDRADRKWDGQLDFIAIGRIVNAYRV